MDKKRVVKCVIDDTGKLGIHAIGLVEYPAIEENWVALNATKLSAVNEERKMLYGLALVPDKYILRVDQTTMEEYYITFDKETIQKCAYQFLQQGLQDQYTIHHESPITGCMTAESWIVEDVNNDKVNSLGLSAIHGAWALGVKVHDDLIWQKAKNGEIKGFSIEGFFLEVALGQQKMAALDGFWNDVEVAVKNYGEKMGNK